MPDRLTNNDGGHSRLRIRAAGGADAEAMLPLIRCHAVHEGGQASVTGAALRSALDASPAVLTAWVAIQGDEFVGYSSATVDFSTWTGQPFLHLDCLFVQDRFRGLGIGAKLLTAVRTHAAERGLTALQWQTPEWNEGAIRFYRREGANCLSKMRFTLLIG